MKRTIVLLTILALALSLGTPVFASNKNNDIPVMLTSPNIDASTDIAPLLKISENMNASRFLSGLIKPGDSVFATISIMTTPAIATTDDYNMDRFLAGLINPDRAGTVGGTKIIAKCDNCKSEGFTEINNPTFVLKGNLV